jgi:hypothetical protein
MRGVAHGHTAHGLGRSQRAPAQLDLGRAARAARARARRRGSATGDGSTPAHGDGGEAVTGGRARRRQRRRRGSDSGRANTAGRGGGGAREAAVGGAGEAVGTRRTGEAAVG